MNMIKILFTSMMLFLSINLYAKDIIIAYPNYDKMTVDDFNTYKIRTDENGIICEISSNSEREGTCTNIQNGNEFTIQHSYKNTNLVEVILTKKLILNNTVIKESNLKRAEDTTSFTYNTVALKPSDEFIFEGEKRSLKKSFPTLNAENQTSRYITKFDHGIVYVAYMNEENIQWKFEYQEHNNKVEVTYSQQMGTTNNLRSYDKFPQRITISENNFHSENETVNIVNYIMLETYNRNIAAILLPLIFFDSPFLNNYWEYSASSFLQEGNLQYSPENLGGLDSMPWASANGYGIGDVLTIKMPVRSQESLVIYNGYQSKEKAYLYMQNSRIKEIEILYKELGKNKTITLMDTPQPQKIDISDILENTGEIATIDIKILDIYKGEKYKDLCIQAILPEEFDVN